MVEMPLAFPLVFTVQCASPCQFLGVAVFGFVVGGGGLGTVLQRSIYTQDMGTILAATAILMGMAVFFDYGMGLIEKRLNAK
jgi:osmoprotectant transport system permease protein